MTTLANRPKTALVVIDVQNNVVAQAFRRHEVIANISTLVARARESGVPVVWVQHSDDELVRDTPGWRYVDELTRRDDEELIHKHFGDSFDDTELEAVLAKHYVGHLVVVGAQSDACIRSTLHGAVVRGYDATLVGDAHTTEDLTQWGAPGPEQVIAHMNLYWKYHEAPGRRGDVVDTQQVSFV